MKPSIPKGTRDFSPAEMQKRQFIFSVLRKNFELFGYRPLETPAMENIETLTGKYGDEGDQLIFKILNSRIHESKEKEKLREEFELSLESSRNSKELTEKALRYDLTVPFARYVVMHQHEITFPFKRYQIQPVWRADKPQKGRYREFYQCDADIIGSNSLLNELELISMIDKSFKELKLPVILKFNNRKILTAIAEVIDEKEKIVDITVAIDKLDKIGKEGVINELQEKGVKKSAIDKLSPLFELGGHSPEKMAVLKEFIDNNETGKKGLEEVEYIWNNLDLSHSRIELDITLARGLNYYTGTIFEVKAIGGTLNSSILGGGRYDNLTGIFGLENVSGVGISFGIDRIYDVMEELNLFPETKTEASTLLFVNFGKEEEKHCLKLASEIRNNDISCEVYPDVTKKLAKQFEYADKKNIPFVCVIGSNEIATKKYVLKNMTTGTQEELDINDIIAKLKAFYQGA